MIDLHCHILPGIDDGPENMEAALAMCRMACEDGIRMIVATPHCGNGRYVNDETSILPVYEKLRRRIREEKIGIELLVAGDIHIRPGLESFLEENRRLCLGGRFALVEWPPDIVPRFIDDFIFRMSLAGFAPILTHPERNRAIQRRPALLKQWLLGGGLTQITAMSLTGEFGPEARESALALLERGWVHCVATDAHSTGRRKPVLSKAAALLKEFIGKEDASRLLVENPRRILAGRQPLTVCREDLDHTPERRGSFFRKSFRLADFCGFR